MSEHPPPPPPPGGTPPPPPGGGGYGYRRPRPRVATTVGTAAATAPAPPGGYGGPPPPSGPGWTVGDAVGYGWKKFKANAGQIIIAGLMVLVGIVDLRAHRPPHPRGPRLRPRVHRSFAGRGFTCTTGSGFVVGLLAIAFVRSCSSSPTRSSAPASSAARSASPRAVQFVVERGLQARARRAIVITALIVSAAIFVGTLLCFLPGIAAAFFLSFSIYFVIDKQMEPVAAVTASFNLVKDNLGEVLVWYARHARDHDRRCARSAASA